MREPELMLQSNERAPSGPERDRAAGSHRTPRSGRIRFNCLPTEPALRADVSGNPDSTKEQSGHENASTSR